MGNKDGRGYFVKESLNSSKKKDTGLDQKNSGNNGRIDYLKKKTLKQGGTVFDLICARSSYSRP